MPAWVRGLPRVRTWVWATLLINAVRILQHKDLQPPLQHVGNVGTRETTRSAAQRLMLESCSNANIKACVPFRPQP